MKADTTLSNYSMSSEWPQEGTNSLGHQQSSACLGSRLRLQRYVPLTTPKPGSDLESSCTTSSPLPMLFPQPGQLPGVLPLSPLHLVQACFVDTPGQEPLPRVPGHPVHYPLQLSLLMLCCAFMCLSPVECDVSFTLVSTSEEGSTSGTCSITNQHLNRRTSCVFSHVPSSPYALKLPQIDSLQCTAADGLAPLGSDLCSTSHQL